MNDAPYKPEWLDRMYNNRARVADHADYFSRWAAESALARAASDGEFDISYDEASAETLDVLPAEGGRTPAPVLVFIHGGWWRSMDKSEHSFIAPAFTRRGACVVMPNYTLCPSNDIPGIVLQTVAALAWTWRNIARFGGDPKRITVAGHSAGGQLAAMMLLCRWNEWGRDLPPDLVKNALGISGLYDLEPIRHTPFLQEHLRLTAESAPRCSPALLPAPRHGQLYSVAGADESEEFLRQNVLIQKAWGERKVPVCEAHLRHNHFSIVDALADPAERLHALALRLLALG